MATREIDLEINFTGNAITTVDDLNDALKRLADSSATAGEEIDRTSSFTQRFDEAVSKSATGTEAANIAIDQLSREISEAGLAYAESAQKIFDAQKKLSEFGASADTQQIALAKISQAVNDFGVDASKAAIVMEELAIEFNDGERAVREYDRAIAFARNSTKRTEDAVADFTDALKGGTSGLAQYGPRARAVADAIDKINDPALRARKATAALERAQREAAKGGTVQSKILDRVALAQLKVAEAGPLVAGGLKIAGAAAAAAAAAFAAFIASGVQQYIEDTPRLVEANERVAASFDDLQRSVGEAVLGDLAKAEARFDAIDRAIQRFTGVVDEYSTEISEFVDLIFDGFDLLAKAVTAFAEFNPLLNLVDLLTELASIGLEQTTIRGLKLLRDGLAAVGVESDALDAVIEGFEDFADVLDKIDFSDAAADYGRAAQKLTGDLAGTNDAVLTLDDSVRSLDSNLRKLSEIDIETALDPLATLNACAVQTGGTAQPATGQTTPSRPTRRRGGRRLSADDRARRRNDRTLRQIGLDDEEIAAAAAEDARAALEEALARDTERIRRELAEAAGAQAALDLELRLDATKAEVTLAEAIASLDGLGEKLEEEFARGRTTAVLEDVGLTAEAVGVQVQGAMAGVAESVGAALVAGEDLGAALGAALVSAIGGMLTTLGAQMVAAGLGFGLAPGLEPLGAGWVAGGLAVTAAGGALQAFASEIGGSGGGRGASRGGAAPTRAGAASGGGIAGAGPTLAAGSEGPEEMTIVAQFGDDATGRVVGRATRRNRRQRATL